MGTKDAKDAKIRIYTKRLCSYCWRAKLLLRRRGVAYQEIRAGDEPELRRWLAEASGQRTLPQLFAGERPLGGYTELVELDRSGELARLLGRRP